MQNFFETTIVSTYIKYLLSCTPLPIYPTINTDDEMIEGVTYIYKNDILKCTKSGRFIGVKGTKYVQDYLYRSSTPGWNRCISAERYPHGTQDI